MKYLMLLLLSVSLVCGAAVYMQTDANGNVSYSDSPSPNAKLVDVPTPSTIQTAAPQKKTHSTEEGDASATGPTPHKPYTDFTISSPEDQQTFQNQREIPVEVSATPHLQKNDSIQLYVDGKKYRDPWFTQHMEIYQVDRGTHTISAQLLDGTQVPIKTSNSVTIYIHYAALGG